MNLLLIVALGSGVMTDKTVEYYNENADRFFETTVYADMSPQRDTFADLLPEGGKILDAGCGSGRDSLAFMKKGFQVEAFDASEELCERAAALLGQQVRVCRFEELDDTDQFDGIWACASLLHVPMEAMENAINRLARALKSEGILYASFKKGVGEHDRGKRRFTDADEAYLRSILEDKFDILEIKESRDVRPGREEEIWMNVFARKILSENASSEQLMAAEKFIRKK